MTATQLQSPDFRKSAVSQGRIPKPTKPERKASPYLGAWVKKVKGLLFAQSNSGTGPMCCSKTHPRVHYVQTPCGGGDRHTVVNHRAPWLHGGHLKPPAMMGKCQDRQIQLLLRTSVTAITLGKHTSSVSFSSSSFLKERL